MRRPTPPIGCLFPTWIAIPTDHVNWVPSFNAINHTSPVTRTFHLLFNPPWRCGRLLETPVLITTGSLFLRPAAAPPAHTIVHHGPEITRSGTRMVQMRKFPLLGFRQWTLWPTQPTFRKSAPYCHPRSHLHVSHDINLVLRNPSPETIFLSVLHPRASGELIIARCPCRRGGIICSSRGPRSLNPADERADEFRPATATTTTPANTNNCWMPTLKLSPVTERMDSLRQVRAEGSGDVQSEETQVSLCFLYR